MKAREVLLVYDEECPVCDAYCRSVKIDNSVGSLRLANARSASSVMDEITRQGLDIDQGMVLQVDGVLHYGADAIHTLASMDTTPGFFGRINRRMFGSANGARFWYPALRTVRNLLLKILRKTKINNLQLSGNRRF